MGFEVTGIRDDIPFAAIDPSNEGFLTIFNVDTRREAATFSVTINGIEQLVLFISSKQRLGGSASACGCIISSSKTITGSV